MYPHSYTTIEDHYNSKSSASDVSIYVSIILAVLSLFVCMVFMTYSIAHLNIQIETMIHLMREVAGDTHGMCVGLHGFVPTNATCGSL